jgi:hypothetical protein
MVIRLFLLCFVTLLKCLTLYHFYKEIIAEESADLFICNCYRLHGVSKVILSDKDPKFVGKFWQSLFM